MHACLYLEGGGYGCRVGIRSINSSLSGLCARCRWRLSDVLRRWRICWGLGSLHYTTISASPPNQYSVHILRSSNRVYIHTPQTQSVYSLGKGHTAQHHHQPEYASLADPGVRDEAGGVSRGSFGVRWRRRRGRLSRLRGQSCCCLVCSVYMY